MPDIIMHAWDPKTQDKTIDLEWPQNRLTIGVLNDNNYADKVLLTPDAVAQLVESGVAVLMERGVGKGVYSDVEYANVGADIMDLTSELLKNVNLVLKLSLLTSEQLEYLNSHTVIMSVVDLPGMNEGDLSLLQQKKSTLIALDKLHDKQDRPIFTAILNGELYGKPAAIALSASVMPSLLAVLCSKNIRYALQTYPALLNGVYCFQGIVCHREMAERFQCIWKDILAICWDWN